MLAYCQKEKRWTFSLLFNNRPDPCDWIAASEESADFEVLATANSQWVVKSETKGAVLPLTHHFLECYDCHGHAQANGDGEATSSASSFCGEHGWCVADKCECEEGSTGLRCEYSDPCPTLSIEINQRDKSRSSASKYYLVDGIQVYNRPVYTNLRPSYLYDCQSIIDFDFMIFTGVRWILSSKDMFPDLGNISDTIRACMFTSTMNFMGTSQTIEPRMLASQSKLAVIQKIYCTR